MLSAGGRDTSLTSIADKVSQVLTDLAQAEEGIGNQLESVSADVTALANTVAANTLVLNVLESFRGSSAGATKTLQDDMAKVNSRLGAIEKQLEGIEKKINYVPESCAHLTDKPANGAVEVAGDHGGSVPISVVAYFRCNTKHYVDADEKDWSTTCQLDGNNTARWSGAGKHPGVQTLPGQLRDVHVRQGVRGVRGTQSRGRRRGQEPGQRAKGCGRL